MLGKLFEKVFVPVAVHEELSDSKTPEIVRRRVASLPSWFEVRTVDETRMPSFLVTLHRGERQAILLAEALQADVLLIDDQNKSAKEMRGRKQVVRPGGRQRSR